MFIVNQIEGAVEWCGWWCVCVGGGNGMGGGFVGEWGGWGVEGEMGRMGGMGGIGGGWGGGGGGELGLMGVNSKFYYIET